MNNFLRWCVCMKSKTLHKKCSLVIIRAQCVPLAPSVITSKMVLPGNFHDGNPCEEGKKEKEVGRWREFPIQLGCFNMPKVKL